jgi:hypothetical protein
LFQSISTNFTFSYSFKTLEHITFTSFISSIKSLIVNAGFSPVRFQVETTSDQVVVVTTEPHHQPHHQDVLAKVVIEKEVVEGFGLDQLIVNDVLKVVL